jgi:hypothetical protein
VPILLYEYRYAPHMPMHYRTDDPVEATAPILSAGYPNRFVRLLGEGQTRGVAAPGGIR